MNLNRLKGEIRASGYTNAEDFCADIGIGKSAYYRKLSGKSQFTQDEMSRIIKLLGLSTNTIMDIFFDNQVSNKTQGQTQVSA